MDHNSGWLEVVCGSMFSGKTEEMIRRLRRAVIAKQKVQVFKPKIDDRYDEQRVTSHAGLDFEAIPITSSGDLVQLLNDDTTVVGIDETQFLDDGIIAVIEKLVEKGIGSLPPAWIWIFVGSHSVVCRF
jgi:thymidine kinase